MPSGWSEPIAFVRRGYSATGGAEAYLKRLAHALHGAGAGELILVGTSDWPREAWPFGRTVRLRGYSPAEFARAVERWGWEHPEVFLFSMERVPGCCVYRAGDGVHASWLERRRGFEPAWKVALRRFSRKHNELLDLERRVFEASGTRCVIANSELVAREIRERFGFPEERLFVVRNGFDAGAPVPGEEERRAARRRLGLGEELFVGLFVGSGWERKGLGQAIAACGRLGQTALLVAGRGPQVRYKAEYVRHFGEVGDLRPLHAAADVFVLPTWYDPFSNACLEAWASGLPVVTTSANGFAELLEEGVTGSVVENPADVRALAERLDFWRRKPDEERAAVRAVCAGRAGLWSIRRNVEATLEVIAKAGSFRALP